MSPRTAWLRSHVTMILILFVSFIFPSELFKAIVSNWSAYNMCTVNCVNLHWAGRRIVRHASSANGRPSRLCGILHFLLIYLPHSIFFINLMVSVNVVLTGGQWLAARRTSREFALSIDKRCGNNGSNTYVRVSSVSFCVTRHTATVKGN